MEKVNKETNVRHRIEVLKSKRDTFKLEIMSFTNFLDEHQDSKTDRNELRRRRDRLQKQFCRFNDDQIERERYEHVETVETEGRRIMDLYFDVIAKANIVLEYLGQPKSVQNNVPGPSTSARHNEDSLGAIQFDGSHKEWPNFKEKFQSILSANPDLDDIQKLALLRSKLSQKMKIAIELFIDKENDFKTAWGQLVYAYDNTFEFAMYHALRLLDTPAMSDNSSESIKNLISHIQQHKQSLEIVARSRSDIAKILLSSLAISKMDPETRKEFEKTLENPQTRDIKDIIKHLEQKVSKCNNHVKPETGSQKSTGDHTRPETKLTMKHSRITGQSTSTSPETKRPYISPGYCHICNMEGHSSGECLRLSAMPVSSRQLAVQDARLCENCLGMNHSTRDCYAKIRCRLCGGKHHFLLHDKYARQEWSPAYPRKRY